MSMPPPPPSTAPPPPPSDYPAPGGYGPPTPSYGYPQLPVGASPTLSRPPGVDATANVLGAVGGLVLTAVGMAIIIHASAELTRRLTFLGDTDVVDVLTLVFGVVLLGSVLVTGRVAPAAPIVPGAVLVGAGLLAMFSDRFLSWTLRNYPIDRDAQNVTVWLAIGMTVVVGGIMISSGIASALARRR